MKFGLIVPDKKKKTPSNTSSTLPAAASIFNEEEFDDEEEEELSALRRANEVIVSKSISTCDRFVEQLHKEALHEDPNIFNYDAALEREDTGRKTIHRNSRFASGTGRTDGHFDSKTEPKYMQNILAKAEERKIESELIKLRNMKRKSGVNEQSETSEEVFLTSAYREKLKELEEKEKELKARQNGEEEGDVTKRKDMHGFYYNLMKRNVSFGGKLADETEYTKKQKLEEPEKQEVVLALEPTEPIVFGPRRPPVIKK